MWEKGCLEGLAWEADPGGPVGSLAGAASKDQGQARMV